MSSRAGVVAACILASAVVACGDDTNESTPVGTRPGDRIFAPSSAFGGGQISPFGVLGGIGGVDYVGATFPLTVLGITGAGPASAAMPEIAQQTTFFDHVFFTESPGVPAAPLPYAVDHYDLLFFGIPIAERDAIDCVNEPLPAPDLVPSGFVVSASSCTPREGLRAFSATSPETVIGYHAGQVAFVGPAVPRATFVARQSFSFAVPRPSHLDRLTLWPTRFDASFDPETDTYSLVFSAFVPLSNIAPIE